MSFKRIIFFDTNFSDSATLTPSTEADAMPATNVQKQLLSQVWKTTDVNAQTLVMDHGSSKTPTYVIIRNHNFTSAVTAKIQADADNSGWDPTPDVNSLTLTYDSKIILAELTGTWASRYHRLYIDDPTNTDSGIIIGRVFLGTVTEFSHNYDYQWDRQLGDQSLIDYSLNGIPSSVIRSQFQTISLNFTYMPTATRDQLLTLWETYGTNKDFFFAIDFYNEPNRLTLYGRFVNQPTIKEIVKGRFNVSIQLRETPK